MNLGDAWDEEGYEDMEGASITAATVPTYYAHIASSGARPTSNKNWYALLCKQLTKYASIVCCCFFRGLRNVRSLKFLMSLQIWFIFVLGILYGLFQELRVHTWDFSMTLDDVCIRLHVLAGNSLQYLRLVV
jgi:hypothetical protein